MPSTNERDGLGRTAAERDGLGRTAAERDGLGTAAQKKAPGRHALYSASESKPLSCTVECSACLQETRVSYLELAALMFPVHFHLPLLKYHSSWFRCPACGERTWLRIHNR